MGVKGAALATVISQGISCVWVLSFLTGSKTVLKIKKENFLTGLRFLPPCIALGMSAFVMQGSESVISLCFNSVSYTHLYRLEDEVLVLTLTRAGTHSDLFGK